MNGASMSLLSLLNAIHSDYEVSLFLFTYNGGFIDKVPNDVTILPEQEDYKYYATPLRDAIKKGSSREEVADAFLQAKDRGEQVSQQAGVSLEGTE